MSEDENTVKTDSDIPVKKYYTLAISRKKMNLTQVHIHI